MPCPSLINSQTCVGSITGPILSPQHTRPYIASYPTLTPTGTEMVKGILWRSRDEKVEPHAALLVKAECSTGPCLVLFFTLQGLKIVAITPAQPSPFCLLAPARVQEAVERILLELGFRSQYHSVCMLSQCVLRGGVEETLKAMMDYEIVRRLEEPEN